MKGPSYLSLFDVLRRAPEHAISSCTAKGTIEYLHNYICECFNIKCDLNADLKKKIIGFCSTLKRKWLKCLSIETKFLNVHSEWLTNVLDITVFLVRIDPVPSTSCGRPVKPFEELNERTKRRRTEAIRKTVPSEELYHATATSLYVEGKRAAMDLIMQATRFSPERPVRLRKELQEARSKTMASYTEDEALAMMIDCRLTKQSYMQLRKGAATKSADIYPTYNRIREAKNRCYPKNISVSEFGVTILLQDLLNHTCERILQTLQFPENNDFFEAYSNINLLCKWGCDGSSGQNEYMQLFRSSTATEESVDGRYSEKHVFMFSLVPLRLTAVKRGAKEKVIFWDNPKPSSVKFCRPIKFVYIKETKENSQEEVAKTNAEINKLTPLQTFINGTAISIVYTMVFTMLDTKVISALTESGAQNCYICGCKPSQMNNLELVAGLCIREENLKYGLSTLHAWIKFLECIVHIAYKLEFQKISIRGATMTEKNDLQVRKSEVQNVIWSELGLKVDRVVQGMGTSNTGNVARRFFLNSQKAAEATGVDVNLITNFSVILQVLSSGHEIDESAFNAYCLDTAKLYVHLYKWYWMPPSVHKILLHGSEAIKYALLPIGRLSEEAQESRNKDFRRFREHNTRKNSRLNTTRDLVNMLLVSSDPVITSHREMRVTEAKELHEQAQKLVRMPNIERGINNEAEAESNNSDDSDSDFGRFH